ncbi:Hint domain-containing protein [Falsirhodobacter deserti]|uniref:Hint domain-containing protein n=1 Tax=Falsirhodobacter deserti TaxID=1365611 RepID=UPI000FE3A09B|nr:Hint domain-containing protein [Falsirhodobacter deserti]
MATGDLRLGYFVATGGEGVAAGDAVGLLQAGILLRSTFRESAFLGTGQTATIPGLSTPQSGAFFLDEAGNTFFVPDDQGVLAGLPATPAVSGLDLAVDTGAIVFPDIDRARRGSDIPRADRARRGNSHAAGGPPACSGSAGRAGGDDDAVGETDQTLCFTPGTMIRTLSGLCAIETLKAGDMVLTRDSGMQPVRWIGQTVVSGMGPLAPVRLRPGAVPDLTDDLLVSPQHSMLIDGYRADLLFGTREVLAPARHLVDGHYITVEEMESVTYIHLMFDRHEVVFANGAAAESYHPAIYGLGGLDDKAREEMFAIFPDLRATPENYGRTARRVLKGYEVSALSW